MARGQGMFSKERPARDRRDRDARREPADPFSEEAGGAGQGEEEVEVEVRGPYRIERGRFGARRIHVYASGAVFSEYRSYRRWLGLPLVHITRGVCPTTGRRITARGVIAVGRRAVGIIAVGQLAVGVAAIGQLALGVAALGQGAVSLTVAVGQLAVAPMVALGQIAIGYIAAGQVAIGHYALGQAAAGRFCWSVRRRDAEAVRFFKHVLRRLLP